MEQRCSSATPPQGRTPSLKWWLGVLSALFVVFGHMAPLSAQSPVDLTGTVRDSLNNEALPNAVVSLVGESYRSLTDEFGRFTLVNVTEGQIGRASCRERV
mgnify:CR=1 FL=1